MVICNCHYCGLYNHKGTVPVFVVSVEVNRCMLLLKSCPRHTLYTSLLLNSSDCLVEFLSEKSSILYHTTSVLMKLDGVCLFCIYWNILASWPISLLAVDLYSYLTQNPLLPQTLYWYLYQCHSVQDRTIADQQITIALKLTFKNRHTELLHRFFHRCM